MDVYRAVAVMRRWWFIVIPVVALSIGLAAATDGSARPEYRSTASVLLVGPVVQQSRIAEDQFDVVNPLVIQPTALLVSAVIVSYASSAPEVKSELANEGLDATYEIEVDADSPIVNISVRARDRDVATETALRLVERIEVDVRSRQDDVGVPSERRATAALLSLTTSGDIDGGALVRIRVLMIALGLGVALAGALVLDSLRTRFARPQQVAQDQGRGTSAHRRLEEARG